MELYESSLLEKQLKMNLNITIGDKAMKEEYDLGTMKSRPNPYAKQLKKQVTMRLEEDIIDYFKKMAEGVGIPYQSLINLYLRDCVSSHRELKMQWQ